MEKIEYSCRVYAIHDEENRIIYIGGTTDIERRFSNHYNQLKNGVHSNAALQQYCKIIGFENLKFRTLMTCEEKELLYYEYFFINLFKPLANIAGLNRPPRKPNKSIIRSQEEIIQRQNEDNEIFGIVMEGHNRLGPINSTIASIFISKRLNRPVSPKRISIILKAREYFQIKSSTGGRQFFRNESVLINNP